MKVWVEHRNDVCPVWPAPTFAREREGVVRG